jgi:hypothetical protein
MKPMLIAVVVLLLFVVGVYAQTTAEDPATDVSTSLEVLVETVVEPKQEPPSGGFLSVSDGLSDNATGSKDLLYAEIAGEELPVDISTLPEIPGETSIEQKKEPPLTGSFPVSGGLVLSSLKTTSNIQTAPENPAQKVGPPLEAPMDPAREHKQEPPSEVSLSVTGGVSRNTNPPISNDRLYIQTAGEDRAVGVNPFLQPTGDPISEQRKNSPFGGSFSVSGGLLMGSINAEVINNNMESATAFTMSFEKTFVPYVSIDGSGSWHWAFLKAGLLFGIPLMSAEATFSNYPDAPQSTMWQEGAFQSFLQSHFQGYAGIGYRVPIGIWFLSHSVGFSYRKRQWDTLDGGWWYNEELNGRLLTVYKDVSGEFMTLTETALYPNLLLEAGLIMSLFEIHVALSLFPFIFSTAEYRFNFISPSNVINTSLKSTGLGGSGTVTVKFHPPKMQSLSLRVGLGYEYMYLTKGEVTNRIEGIGSTDAAKDPHFSAFFKSSLFNLNIGIGLDLK